MLADETLVDPVAFQTKNGWANEMAYAEYVGEIMEKSLHTGSDNFSRRFLEYSVEYNGLNANGCSSMVPDS